MAKKIIMAGLVLLTIGAFIRDNAHAAAVPDINVIVPNQGPASGGTEVTIIGKNFAEGAEVFFGSIAATVVIFRSASGIDCIVPGNTAGKAEVTVINPEGQSAVTDSDEGFLYKAVRTPVIIPPLVPDEGHISGNTLVTLKGANFKKGASVTFDGIQATEVKIVSDAEINCKTPEHEKGTVDVIVSHPDEEADICEQCYTYFTGCPLSEREALMELYNNTDGENWYDNINWLGDRGTECSWKGITCNEERTHIVEIRLDNNHLEGKLPAALGNLSELQVISLKTNYLSGSVPKEISNLLNLADRQSDFRGNCLWAKDSDVRDFLSSKQIGEEWEGSQRNCCVSQDMSLSVSSVHTEIGVTNENLDITLTGTGFGENASAAVFRKDENGELVGDEKEITDINLVSETELGLTLADISEPGAYSLKISAESETCELSDALVFEASEDMEKQKQKKAIIIAGSGPYSGNALWNATLTCANKAYHTLINQGYTDDTICYLNPETGIDITGDGVTDVDGDTTLENLSEAIKNWAEDADELLLYMTGHGGDNTFNLNSTTTMDILNAGELDGWLDTFQQTRDGKVILIYDSAMSGSFLPLMTPPSEKKRIFISSSSATERAWFLNDGKTSFSYVFWETLRVTGNLYSAFVNAKETMKADQTAMLDSDGNGIGNEDTDKNQIEKRMVGLGRSVRTELPHIGKVFEKETLGCGENSITLWASDIAFLNPIQRLWAIIIPPQASDDPTIPITDMPSVDLTDDNNDGTYEADYENFTQTGIYKIFIYLKDEKGDQASPVESTVIQTCKGEVNGDNSVDLRDAVIVLKLLAGTNDSLTIRPDYIDSNIEVGGDEKISLADIIYILKKVAGAE
ncbi:IPT/TIG domain-containing protein [Desulfonema magnum]|uniref:Peptidase C13 family domain-containing protein n=1 Tax=Desulfonema magnum TaxID=45655 RepID=A0A975GTL4_9BACT|nr:IPT/TIG domain-containing protein [Desulfonema magnum]QTA92263.1 Peptidase C13 family domain-containing protein [Desulfonema magnum]